MNEMSFQLLKIIFSNGNLLNKRKHRVKRGSELLDKYSYRFFKKDK